MVAPSEDLLRRRPVWQALSDLFLDTELTEAFYRYIARTVIESGYGPAEIRGILWDEVFPVLELNLRHPAGSDPNSVRIANRAEIGMREPGEISGLDELSSEESAPGLELLARIGSKAPALAFRQPVRARRYGRMTPPRGRRPSGR